MNQDRINRFSLLLRKSTLFLIIAMAVSCLISSSQDIVTSSELAASYYDNVYGIDQRLVSGDFNYGPMRGSISGHPFFIDDSWKEGAVLSDTILFTNLTLRYDIYKNEVVMRFVSREYSTHDISLKKENIDRFWMDNRIFIPFPGSRDSTNLKFCEILVEGYADFLVLGTKEMVLTNGSGLTDFEYKENRRQFLLIDNNLIPFPGKRALFRIDPDAKRELREFMSKNNLTTKKSEITNRARLINFYNSIKTTVDE